METTSKKIGSNVAKLGDFIGNNKKSLFYVGGAIIVVFAGQYIAKKLKNVILGRDILGSKFTEQDIDTSKTTISQAKAKNYAESLLQAFNYTWGTDKGTISAIFSKINSEDFKLVYNAFGVRSYSDLNGGSPTGVDWTPSTWIGHADLDLVGWLNSELEFGDSALRNKIRPIVDGAGFILEK